MGPGQNHNIVLDHYLDKLKKINNIFNDSILNSKLIVYRLAKLLCVQPDQLVYSG